MNAEMPATVINYHTATTTIPTGRENVKLVLVSSHVPGTFRFSVRRVEVLHGIPSTSTDRDAIQNPAPIDADRSPVVRFTEKGLATFHANHLALIDQDTLNAAILWAEQY